MGLSLSLRTPLNSKEARQALISFVLSLFFFLSLYGYILISNDMRENRRRICVVRLLLEGVLVDVSTLPGSFSGYLMVKWRDIWL